MPASVVIFTGAPEHNSLDWSEGGLLSNFTIPGKRLVNQASQLSALSGTIPKWRAFSLSKDNSPPLDSIHEAVGKSSAFYVYSQDEQEEFFNHSVTVLQSIDPTRLTQATSSFETSFAATTSTNDSTSFGPSPTNDSTDPSGIVRHQQRAELLRQNLNIIDLIHIPSAAHVLFLNPQTITVDLIVGIIAISAPKTVSFRRKRNYERQIIELTIGDNTRAGFAVNIWLRPEQLLVNAQRVREKDHGDLESDTLRRILRHLRKGDLIALQNVALSTFRGNVYGQSLNRGFAKNSTKITRIERGSALFEAHAATVPDLVAKIESVAQWVGDFVGEPNSVRWQRAGAKRRYDQMNCQEERLPPDTQ